MGRNTNYKRDFVMSDFYCTECGNKGISCARQVGQAREPGHLKKLYCVYCNKVTNHTEIRPYGTYTKDSFDEEFELGRYSNGNKVPVNDLIKCSKADCEYNINGRCWNSNYSYNCKHRSTEWQHCM